MKPITEECQTIHTTCPTDYVGWHEWAEKMSKTHKQEKCPHCGLLAVWVKKRTGTPDDGLREEVADMIFGGGTHSERWPDALDLSDQIIELVRSRDYCA